MVEGPVESINVNVITIYNIELVLAEDDPILARIQVGDVLRVEGDFDSTLQVIVAVTVQSVSVDINVNTDTGEAWRDDGNCSNPPPPWAPANGWRRRCEGQQNNSGDGNGNDNGMGMGDDDDDD